MTQTQAEALALAATGWLVGQEEILPVFLGASGASEADLRTGLSDPAFLAAVLDFMMLDDSWVVAFCDTQGLDYSAPMQARAALPGGAQMHWT